MTTQPFPPTFAGPDIRRPPGAGTTTGVTAGAPATGATVPGSHRA